MSQRAMRGRIPSALAIALALEECRGLIEERRHPAAATRPANHRASASCPRLADVAAIASEIILSDVEISP